VIVDYRRSLVFANPNCYVGLNYLSGFDRISGSLLSLSHSRQAMDGLRYLVSICTVSVCDCAGRRLAGETVNSAFLIGGALVLVGVWVGAFSGASAARKA